ncbi:alpha/beta hydrolase fold protein [Pigmentiphaga humi]|uniref:Alpha/beta hydrolase fold protein n=1 Tax=Pigmentiphaga humi TaxID=2478468 RepID=A0A3P4BAF8_9BURK|nr:alpha/beta hydrolase [Pigmentiphaga humi]VCU72516.1 alpha/beta hydrolase fold protein [Pigmentiphaga humi]
MSVHPLHDHPAYTPEFCESGYNNLVRIPDHLDYFSRWASDAALARRGQACQLGLRYGDAPAETLDYFPSRKPGAPLLVFIHGGYWRALDKSCFSWLAPAYVARGAAVAIVGYGLAPATPLEDIARQMLRAHAWLYRHAGELGFDARRIVTSGHSAGGQLTGMLLGARWNEWESGLPAGLISGGLSLSGLFDLEPVAKAPFLANLGLTPDRVRQLSPAYFTPDLPTPLIAAVGGSETPELQRQTSLIAACWPRNVRRTLVVPDCNHLDICDRLADPSEALFGAACELLGL